MEKKVAACVIISAAPSSNVSYIKNYIQDGDFVICADGGLKHAIACGILPDLLVGDFDSLDADLPEAIERLKLPVMKDDTDTMAAVKTGLQRGYRRFTILCATGGRLDHTYANLCTMQYILSQGGEACLVDADTSIYLIRNKKMLFKNQTGKTLSVFPFGCRFCTVTYEGLLYPLDHVRLYADGFPMGVSNIIIENTATVEVHKGDALIMLNNKV